MGETNIAIALSARAFKSRVVINSVDVSEALTGVEVSAHVNDVTRVTLFMSHVDVMVDGEPGELLKSIPEEPRLVGME
jgi:hypothetical protein